MGLGCKRLLRYCARPPFALHRLRELDRERLLYESTKPGPGGNDSLLLTPLELLDRLAARYAWALLLARIYEVFPLVCPRPAAVGGRQRRARADPRSGAPAHPGLRVDQRIAW